MSNLEKKCLNLFLSCFATKISKYLEKLWISEDEYNSGANTFSLTVWQPSWLEQSLVKRNLINGPITGHLSEEIIETAKNMIKVWFSNDEPINDIDKYKDVVDYRIDNLALFLKKIRLLKE